MAKSFPNTGVTTGLAADRAALTSPFAGMQFFETDTNLMFVYNGSAWVLPYEQRVAQVNASGSSSTMSATGLSQAGNHMRIVASFRSSRASFSNTGGRFLINGLNGADDYKFIINSGTGQGGTTGYIGQIPAATAVTSDVAIVNMLILNYRNQNSLGRININTVTTSYTGNTHVIHNFVGNTTGIGAVTSITFQDDVGATLAAGLNNFSVYIFS